MKIRIFFLIFCIVNIQITQTENFTMEATNVISSDGLSLKYLIREPLVKAEKKKAIVLLHGVGSNESDLFSLAKQLPKDFYVICPRGKFTLAEGSYAWYSIDFSTGKPIFNLEQEKESRGAIITFLDQVKEKYQLEEVFLGGFSQGGIMSFSIGLTKPSLVKGIVVMSGRLLAEIKPLVDTSGNLKQLKVFMAHGTHDRVLPIAYANEAKAYIAQLPIQLSYHEYNMGHEVCVEEINELNLWLGTHSMQK